MNVNPLFYECKLIKQVVYKLKNQLGRTLQFRKLMQVYKTLKKYISGAEIDNFENIIEEAAMSLIDLIHRRLLTPACSLILSIYARIFWIIIHNKKTIKKRKTKTKIISRRLKKLVGLSKVIGSFEMKIKESKFEEIRKFLGKL
ncbi:unnamed protein product [Blepharisma stoltei]|uniref:Uncharacterized protein n=1 Tax=Blepharisma stoltei TaxID=1481888 RepID=A0AAU9JEW3_9CILI|nr:unnamed protein product [Blepharisma stoltei]